MPKPKTERYLRRKCHVCGHVGDVPKFTEDLRRDDIVFWAASPYQEELANELWYNWWCGDCIREDANDI